MGDFQLVGGSAQEVVQVAVGVGCLSVAIAAKELAHDAVPPRRSAIVVHSERGRLVLGHFVRISVLSREARIIDSTLVWCGTRG
jgi:hypothetical protein